MGRGRPIAVSVQDIEDIRNRYSANHDIPFLMKKYNLSYSTIYNVIRGTHVLTRKLPNLSGSYTYRKKWVFPVIYANLYSSLGEK